jgi:hypothetical protein
MDAELLCRSMLALVDAIPSAVPWHVVAVDRPQWVFIADQRPEASTLELSGVAGGFGSVIAEACFHSRRSTGHAILGCITQVSSETDTDEAVEQLRAAYALATSSTGQEPGDTGPF